MKKQSGGALVVALSLVAVLIIVPAAIGIISWVKWHDYANTSEVVIDKEYKNMENIRATYGLKIAEAAQIPKMQTEDLTKLFTGSLGARYGANGSQAAMQWIKEQNPNLDQSTYKQIMIMIEAGRNKFENAQTHFLDTKSVYVQNMGNAWSGFWISAAGYPKINLADYVIISSSDAKEAFETKVDTAIKL